MAAAPPTLILTRRPRHGGAEWRNARSWFGGAPRLGGAEWPRTKTGQPLHFVAQVDLAEIAAKTGKTPLPKQGSLAFFVGGNGAVIYAPDHMNEPPTEPPAGMADLTTVGGDPAWPFDLKGRALFPFWSIDVARLDIDAPENADEEERMKAQYAAVAKRFARREYNLSPSAVFAGPPIPDWWRCAIFVADQLDAAVRNAPKVMGDSRRMLAYTQDKLDEAQRREADAIEQARRAVNPQESGAGMLSRLLFGRRQAAPDESQRRSEEARRKAAEAVKSAEASVALYERKIEKLHRLLPGFMAFAAEVADWTRGRDPWSLMGADDRAQLIRYSARMTEFPEYTIQYGVTPLNYIKTQMFAKLPKPDDPGFATLRADVREVISGRLAPRPQWWRSTILFTESLQKAVAKGEPPGLKATREKLAAGGVEKAEALAKLLAQQAAFPEFAAEFAAWAEGRDPWCMMSDEEGALLWARLERLRTEFRDVASACRVDRFETLERTTLLALLTEENEIYETLPAHAREQIHREYLLPIDIMHQMFGEPVFIQGDSCAQAEEGKHLLLQLGFDDLMFWTFGDNGDYQFWISPEDLARRNWDGVMMTFECH